MNHIEVQQQIKQYRSLDLHRKIGTNSGFFEMYFSALPQHPTRNESFNYVNDLHFQLFGEYRYSSYASFYKSLNNSRKNKNG